MKKCISVLGILLLAVSWGVIAAEMGTPEEAQAMSQKAAPW